MSSGFDEGAEEPKDRAKWVWLGVLLAIAVMAVLLWAAGNQQFRGKSVVRAKHILIQFNPRDPADRASALELVTELRQRIRDGERFSALAREFSADAFSSARGGDLGYQPKGAFEDAFEEYAWTAPLNTISEIVTTAHGFHLVVVVNRHLSEADAYEQGLRDRVKEEAPSSPVEDPAPTP